MQKKPHPQDSSFGNLVPPQNKETLLEETSHQENVCEESQRRERNKERNKEQNQEKTREQRGDQSYISGLSALPTHILDALETATLRLQWDDILTQIEAIRVIDQALADRVSQTIENFRYSQVIESLQAIKTSNSDSGNYPTG